MVIEKDEPFIEDEESKHARERLILQYVCGFDRGDMDAVGKVIEASLDDPELARIIDEINQVLAEEEGLA